MQDETRYVKFVRVIASLLTALGYMWQILPLLIAAGIALGFFWGIGITFYIIFCFYLYMSGIYYKTLLDNDDDEEF